MSGTTADRPAPGVVIHQPARGFRYGSEAFWAVGCALEHGPVTTALDLGTGSGVMACLLAAHGASVLGVDVRPEWQACWLATLRDSRFAGEVRLELADVVSLQTPEERPALVVCNPPFFQATSGPAPVDPWRAAARFEGTATVADFVATALRVVASDGRVIAVVPVARELDVRAACTATWAVASAVQVGHTRVLLTLGRGAVEAPRRQVAPKGDEVAAWVAAVRDVPGGTTGA